MLHMDSQGYILDKRIKRTPRPLIEHGVMHHINGIIVHQTGGSTAASSLSSYMLPGAMGAHFLIDKDGTIYQVASLHRQTWHVGKLRSRCLAEHRCSPAEMNALRHFSPTNEHHREMHKQVPDRYPSNEDSVGIELVGATNAKNIYEPVTAEENASLHWLVTELTSTFGVQMSEIFRHPVVARKTATEAQGASW